MKYTYIFLLIFILSFGISIFAQENSPKNPICEQPLSSKFDEFEFTTLEDAKERLDLYALQIKNLNAAGIIIGYSGKITESGKGRSIAYKIEEYLTNKFNFYKYVTISAREGGHREKPTVELFLKPERCSEEPQSFPTLNYDEVSYKEESAFFTKDIFRKSKNELENLLVKRVEPIHPAAAKAVRARGKVLLLVIIDENGNVLKAKAIDGHPLLRSTSEIAVKNWKYQRTKENSKPVKVGGKVIIDWDIIAVKWEREYTIIDN